MLSIVGPKGCGGGDGAVVVGLALSARPRPRPSLPSHEPLLPKPRDVPRREDIAKLILILILILNFFFFFLL
jgi:hypothetical protein